MNFSKFFANVKRYNENATVIFDHDEPVGQPTDLVMPRRRWFRRAQRKDPPPAQRAAAPHRS
jgi:hypothetical protein